jgi:hypothetical protein
MLGDEAADPVGDDSFPEPTKILPVRCNFGLPGAEEANAESGKSVRLLSKDSVSDASLPGSTKETARFRRDERGESKFPEAVSWISLGVELVDDVVDPARFCC